MDVEPHPVDALAHGVFSSDPVLFGGLAIER
jgi:hypothetical protein